MKEINHFISESLKKRELNHSLRHLKPQSTKVDFCSNDYLGFARSEDLRQKLLSNLNENPEFRLGSGGSRLIAGNDHFTERLEEDIADFHQAEAALIYNSGYDANVGLFSCLAQRGDTIISDEYIHASIIDGIRLSHAQRFVFRHNDMDSLEQKLKLAKGRIFIAVESLYSMDGDEAPLKQIASLALKYHAAIIVDEAHACGIFGTNGRGLVEELGLCDIVFARVITFGKALGTHGAAVLGSRDLRSYLINFSRSFIYTTAQGFVNHLSVKLAYDFLKEKDHQLEIKHRIELFKTSIKPDIKLLSSRSPIQIVIIPGSQKVKETEQIIQEAGYDVKAILSPTIPEGSERLRICLHNHNTSEEILELCKLLNKIIYT